MREPDETSNNPNVTVSYIEGADPEWVVQPRKVRMTAAGKILFHRKSGQTWKFVRIEGLPAHWQHSNQGENLYTVDNPYHPRGEFRYRITISVNGREVSSPELVAKEFVGGPPIIMNE